MVAGGPPKRQPQQSWANSLFGNGFGKAGAANAADEPEEIEENSQWRAANAAALATFS